MTKKLAIGFLCAGITAFFLLPAGMKLEAQHRAQQDADARQAIIFLASSFAH